MELSDHGIAERSWQSPAPLNKPLMLTEVLCVIQRSNQWQEAEGIDLPTLQSAIVQGNGTRSDLPSLVLMCNMIRDKGYITF